MMECAASAGHPRAFGAASSGRSLAMSGGGAACSMRLLPAMSVMSGLDIRASTAHIAPPTTAVTTAAHAAAVMALRRRANGRLAKRRSQLSARCRPMAISATREVVPWIPRHFRYVDGSRPDGRIDLEMTTPETIAAAMAAKTMTLSPKLTRVRALRGRSTRRLRDRTHDQCCTRCASTPPTTAAASHSCSTTPVSRHACRTTTARSIAPSRAIHIRDRIARNYVRAAPRLRVSPAVIRRMPFLHRHERAAAGAGDLAVRLERRFDHRPVPARLDHVRAQLQRRVHGRGALEHDVKVRGDGAGRRVRAGLAHQVHGRGPVAVAVQESAADAAVENVVESLVVRLGRPGANQLVAILEAADAQP